MSDELTDQRIDEVARQMTAAAPPDAAAFRRRVLARIDADDVRRSSFGVRRAALMWTPIAAAAVLVVTLVVAREHRPAETIRRGPETTSAPSAGAAVEAGNESPRTVATATVAPRTVARAVAPHTRAARTSASATQLESNDVASIAVAPLVLDIVPTESIQVERLDPIAPIAVAPLDSTEPSRRNR